MTEKDFFNLLLPTFGCKGEDTKYLPPAWDDIVDKRFPLEIKNAADDKTIFTFARIDKLKRMLAIVLEIYSKDHITSQSSDRNSEIAKYRIKSPSDRIDAACWLMRVIIYMSCEELRGDTPDNLVNIKDEIVLSELFLWAFLRGFQDMVSGEYLDVICTIVYEYFILLFNRFLPHTRLKKSRTQAYLSDPELCKTLFADLLRVHTADFTHMKSEIPDLIEKGDSYAQYIFSHVENLSFLKSPHCNIRNELLRLFSGERRMIMMVSHKTDEINTSVTRYWDAGPSVIMEIIRTVIDDLWYNEIICDGDYVYNLLHEGEHNSISNYGISLYCHILCSLLFHKFLVIRWNGLEITDELIKLCIDAEAEFCPGVITDAARIESQYNQMKSFLTLAKELTTKEQRFPDIMEKITGTQLFFGLGCGLFVFYKNSKCKKEPNEDRIYDAFIKSIYNPPLS